MQKTTEILVDNSANNPNYKIEIEISGTLNSLFIYSPNSKYYLSVNSRLAPILIKGPRNGVKEWPPPIG